MICPNMYFTEESIKTLNRSTEINIDKVIDH